MNMCMELMAFTVSTGCFMCWCPGVCKNCHNGNIWNHLEASVGAIWSYLEQSWVRQSGIAWSHLERYLSYLGQSGADTIFANPRPPSGQREKLNSGENILRRHSGSIVFSSPKPKSCWNTSKYFDYVYVTSWFWFWWPDQASCPCAKHTHAHVQGIIRPEPWAMKEQACTEQQASPHQPTIHKFQNTDFMFIS